MTSRNETLFQRAQQTIPGGVNSPVRAFRSVGGTPRFLERAEGARVWDADGNVYLDYVGSWGPAIAGHAHPAIVEAVREAALKGLSFGAPTERVVELAQAARPEGAGRYHTDTVAADILAMMHALSPAYLRAQVARLEMLAEAQAFVMRGEAPKPEEAPKPARKSRAKKK